MVTFLRNIAFNRKFAVKCMMLFCLLFTISTIQVSNVTMHAEAKGGWVENDEKLYGDDEDAKKIKDAKDSDDEPGLLEGLLIKLINAINGWLDSMFKGVGLSFDNIVFGRVNGNGVKVDGHRMALYTYEMHNYNVYGIISMAIYNAIRGVIFVVLIGVILFRLVRALYTGNSSQALTYFKESMGSMFLGLVLLALMPYILDVAIYIRDVILQSVATAGTDTLGISTKKNLQITSWFSKNADASIMNAIMWTASYVLMLYFALQYIGIALCMIVNIIAFPFVCLNMQFDKQAMQNWLKQTVSYLVIPIADCCLLMIPAAFGIIAGKSGTAAIHIVQFIVCTQILSARSSLQNALGVMRNPALEMGSMLTFLGMAKLGGAIGNATVGNAFRGIAGAFGSMRGGMREANAMNTQADMYQDMANAEKGIMPDAAIQSEGIRSPGKILGSLKSGLRGTGIHEDTEAFTGAVTSSASAGSNNPGGSDGGAGYTFDMQEPIRREDVFGEDEFSTRTSTDTSIPVSGEMGRYAGTSEADENRNGEIIQSDNTAGIGVPVANASGVENTAADASDDGVAAAKQAVLNKYANKDNFDSSQFRGLSNERKAQLQRERAAERKKQAFKESVGAIGRAAAGTVGGVSLGALTGGVSMFASPGFSMAMAAAGVNGGNSLGGNLGFHAASAAAGAAWTGAGKFVNRNKNRSSMADVQSDGYDASGEMFTGYPIINDGGPGSMSGVTLPANEPSYSSTAENNYGSAFNTNSQDFFGSANWNQGTYRSANWESKEAYKKDFADFTGQNADIIRNTFTSVSNLRQKGTEGNRILNDVARNYEGGDYYQCREHCASEMAQRFSTIVKSSGYASTGSGKKDAEIVAGLQKGISNMLNPVAKNNVPIDVPDNHPLSRKSFENAGIVFGDTKKAKK